MALLLHTKTGQPAPVLLRINAEQCDGLPKPHSSFETRVLSVLRCLEQDLPIAPPRVRPKADGRFEIEDGRARIEAYRRRNEPFLAQIK